MRVRSRSVGIVLVAVPLVMLFVNPQASRAETLERLLVRKGIITQGEAESTNSPRARMSIPNLSYDNGLKFEVPDAGFVGKINFQLQERYTYTDTDVGNNSSSFDTRRARIVGSGSVLDGDFDFKIQGDFVGTEDADGAHGTDLRDAWVRWNASDALAFRLGQFKTGISRQFNTSSVTLQFPDRSAASEEFDLGRQQGIDAEGDVGDLSWTVALFNGHSDGEGRNKPGVDTNHAGVLNLRYDVMGDMDPFEEGDIDGTESPALNIGVAGAFSEDEVGSDTDDNFSLSADANFKYDGFSFNGEYFYRNDDFDNAESLDTQGFYVQSGYFLIPSKFEVAGRYSFVDFDSADPRDQLNEISGSLNYYWWRHQLKAQIEYTYRSDDPEVGSSLETNRIIAQVSAWF